MWPSSLRVLRVEPCTVESSEQGWSQRYVYALCTGVYVGCSYQDYTDVVLAVTAKLAPQVVVGSGASFMVGRLSYAFGLTGRATCMSLALLDLALPVHSSRLRSL